MAGVIRSKPWQEGRRGDFGCSNPQLMLLRTQERPFSTRTWFKESLMFETTDLSEPCIKCFDQGGGSTMRVGKCKHQGKIRVTLKDLCQCGCVIGFC